MENVSYNAYPATPLFLRSEHRSVVSKMHFALIRGGGVTDRLIARADGGRREHRRVVSEMHFPLICGSGVTDCLIARADGGRSEHRSVVSEMHFALICGSGVTDRLVAQSNLSHGCLRCYQSPVDCISSLKGAERPATKQKLFP